MNSERKHLREYVDERTSDKHGWVPQVVTQLCPNRTPCATKCLQQSSVISEISSIWGNLYMTDCMKKIHFPMLWDSIQWQAKNPLAKIELILTL